MIGIDTDILIAFELAAHPRHQAAREIFAGLVAAGEELAISAQVLAEFVHVATDGRRFSEPMEIGEALARAKAWISDRETVVLVADEPVVRLAFEWMLAYQLGRKRVLDTLLAASYHAAGIKRLATLNEADFRVFNLFEFVSGP